MSRGEIFFIFSPHFFADGYISRLASSPTVLMRSRLPPRHHTFKVLPAPVLMAANQAEKLSSISLAVIYCKRLRMKPQWGEASVALGGRSNQTFCFCVDKNGFHLDSYVAERGTE